MRLLDPSEQAEASYSKEMPLLFGATRRDEVTLLGITRLRERIALTTMNTKKEKCVRVATGRADCVGLFVYEIFMVPARYLSRCDSEERGSTKRNTELFDRTLLPFTCMLSYANNTDSVLSYTP